MAADWRTRLEKKLSGVLNDERIQSVRARMTKVAEEASGVQTRGAPRHSARPPT